MVSFEHLVIANAMVIDGTGAPPQGPLSIHIENDRIVNITGVGVSSMHLDGDEYGPDVKVIDATGKYVLPGFIDSHVHYGTPSHIFGGALTDPEYVGKLMLAHGNHDPSRCGWSDGLRLDLGAQASCRGGRYFFAPILSLMWCSLKR